MIQFKQYLTEIKQNQLYKEFRKAQKNPQQMELPFEFDDEIFTSNEEIARHILRQLNFISIGFEFEMYLKDQIPENFSTIHDDILKTSLIYFDPARIKNNVFIFSLKKEFEQNKTESLTFEKYIDNKFKSFKEFAIFCRLLPLRKDDMMYINFKKLSKTLEDGLSIKCKIFDNRHDETKDSYNYWYIEPDGSLTSSKLNNYFPVEIVTKTYPAYKYKEVFNSLLKVLNDNGYEPLSNKTTGLHFSISFDNKELNSNINLLKLIILGNDKFFLKKLGREYNEHCRSQYKIIISNIEELTEKYGLLTHKVINDNNILNRLSNSLHPIIKYRSINFSKYQIESSNKFIEFRITGNDYLKEFKELSLRTIDWFLFIIIAASSKTLLEDEFYKKIEEISRRFVEKKDKL